MQDGCGCTLSGKGGQCCEQFSEETVLFNLNNCQELSHGELDLVILTSIQAFTNSDPIGGKRNRSPRSSFFFQSKTICKDMFLHFYGISYSRFVTLHGKTGKKVMTRARYFNTLDKRKFL